MTQIMDIRKARDIATSIQEDRPGIFSRDDIRSAFHRLDRGMRRASAPVRAKDRQLARVIWDHVKTWN